MVDYTPVLRLVQPDFDQTPWDEDVNNNFAVLDAAYGKFIGIEGLTGTWTNATTYVAGQSAVDATDSTLWVCAITHTSANVPTTFAQERAANPSYWTSGGALLLYMPLTGGTATGNIGVTGPAGTSRNFYLETAGKLRWIIQAGGEAETGANAGSHFTIIRYADSGAAIDVPFEIQRNTGQVSVNDLATNNAVRFANTGGFIAGDGTTVTFIQDSNLWRWEYIRSGPLTGVMQWTRGDNNQILFRIDPAGNVYCHGAFFPGSVFSAKGEVLSYHDRIGELEARIAALEAKM